MKRIISLLIIVFTLVSLSSCGRNIFPRGYTGGLGIPFGSGRQIFWVETLEDTAKSAISLKDHDSTFLGGYIFEEDDEIFDVKYCFIFDHKKDKIKYHEDPYDRWAEKVEIRAYGFYVDVTIDELLYSDIDDYEYITISFTDLYYEKYAKEYIDPIMFECRWDDDSMKYYGTYNEEKIFSVEYHSAYQSIPSDSSLIAIMQTLIYIETNEFFEKNKNFLKNFRKNESF